MSFENPKEGFTSPIENLEELRQKAKEYFDLLMEKYGDGYVSDSAQDILGNVAGSIQACWEIVTKGRPEEAKEFHQYLLDNIEYAKRYLDLLKDFPAFAEKELKRGSKGFFPELFRGNKGFGKLIDDYESALRGEAK